MLTIGFDLLIIQPWYMIVLADTTCEQLLLFGSITIIQTMKVNVDIGAKTFIKFGIVMLAFVVGVYLLILAKQPIMILGLSLFVALALNPPVSALAKRLPGRSRIGATAIAYLAVLAIISGVTILVAPPVIEQSTKFAETVPGLIEDVADQQVIVNDFVQRYSLTQQYNEAVDNAQDRASDVAANLGNVLVAGAGNLLNGIAILLIIVVLAFLMLIEGPTLMRSMWGLYQDPVLLDRHRELVHKMYRVVTGFVNGQMIVAGIAGVSTLVVILILSSLFDLPANLAIPLAVIVAITGFIPMVGATIGAILVLLVLALNSFTAAVVFAIFFLIYQQIENNLISPSIQSKTVDISALMVLSAILIGVSIFGLIGGIISIPIAGILKVILIDYLEHAKKKRSENRPKAVLKKAIKKN